MFVTKSTMLIYTNSRGMSTTLAPFSTFWVEKCEEETENGINSEKQSGIDGEAFISSSLEKRHITISGFFDDVNFQAYKNTIERVFNPTLSGILTYENTETREVKYIDCRVESVPATWWDKSVARFSISLVALNPYWYSGEVKEVLAVLIKNFSFPLVIPKSTGFYFGMRQKRLEAKFQNIGDVDAGFRVIFKAKSGSAKNPSVINRLTGQAIKINYQMLKDDILELINYPNLVKITINGDVNGFKYLDDTQDDFFRLPVGENEIGYTADENITNLEVSVCYIPQYLGAGR